MDSVFSESLVLATDVERGEHSMGWLLEDPTTVLTAGILIQVLLAVMLVKTARGSILFAMGAVFVLVILLVVVEFTVVTPREEIENTLYQAATAAEANDVEQFMTFIAPASAAGFSEVQSRMPRFDIRSVRLGQLQVEFDDSGTAMARMIASVEADDRQSQIPRDKYIARFSVNLRKVDDRWMMVAYQEEPLTGSP